MSDSSPSPRDTLGLLPSPPPRSKLAKLATIFAITFGIAFGLCTISATAGMGVNEKVAGFFVSLSTATEVVCLLGLLVTGAIALFLAINRT